MENFKSWFPTAFCSRKGASPHYSKPFAVIVLNQPIENREVFISVCSRAVQRVCADGGANRVKDLDLVGLDEESCRPDIIAGDLDSIQPNVAQYYKQLGVRIEKDPDQYSTDIDKCLRLIQEYAEDQLSLDGSFQYSRTRKAPTLDIAIFGGLGGRADQAFSQLHHLYKASRGSESTCGDMYLITPESIIFLLHKGLNKIHTPMGLYLLAENVGIIPIAKPSVITTQGFEWDVKDWSTEFGAQISTSNHIRNEFVQVETTERVLFTVELNQKP